MEKDFNLYHVIIYNKELNILICGGQIMHQKEKSKFLWNLIQSILVIFLIILVGSIIMDINKIQGSAKIINYAGIVRGGTQRLVKLEIAKKPNDALMEELDTIIRDLKNGEGTNNLVKMQDGDFRSYITNQEIMWNQLKDEILDTRVKGAENTNILELSEEYFQMANETVKAAEIYADKFATKLKNTEIILAVNVASIILLLVYQTVAAIILNHKNKELNKLAFIDINTGLPNKGCCDKFLYEHGILSSNQTDACIMFDLNNLKVVNDNFGHKAGDALIMNFANILRRTASEKVFVGRYGGDEFIAILLDTSKEEVEALLKNIDDNIKEFSKEENGTAISYAAGYELSSDYKDCTLQILMDKADKKMYADKAEKKKDNMLNKL